MYVSMTGFGRTQTEAPFGTINFEISSINHRYQDITVRLPREFSSWEPWFHQQLRGFFHRGKVQCRMEVVWEPSVKGADINGEVLSKYYRDLEKVQNEIGLLEEIRIENMLSLPGVVENRRFEDRSDDDYEALFKNMIEETAKSWLAMRRSEGEHLKTEILTHLGELEDLVEKIEGEWAKAKDGAFEAMKARLTEALESVGEELESARYLQEIVIMTDKWDVSEELARLHSHIEKFKQTGGENKPIGRKLDFIVQEINREINTLDSKIADASVRWLAVNAKAALERVREQIQNLE